MDLMVMSVPLFSDRPYDSYQTFILRNSGNDWNSTMLRDGFLQEIVVDTEADRMEYRPAILYLNGQYWGIHNIREKINEDYLYIFFNHTLWMQAFGEDVRGVCDRTAPDGTLLSCATNGRNWFSSIWFA